MYTQHTRTSRVTATHPLASAGPAQAADAGSPLLDAVRRQDRKAVATWLQREPGSIRHRDRHGNTALHLAMVPHCDLAIVDLLLANRADPAVLNDEGNTCMHLAFALRPPVPALPEKLMKARWLGDGLGLGAVGLRNGNGQAATALARDAGGRIVPGYERAAAEVDVELASWMLGVVESLMAALGADDAAAVTGLVRSTGWRLDMPLDQGRTLLSFALDMGAKKSTLALLGLVRQQGCTAVLNAADESGLLTPMLLAMADKDLVLAHALLDAGAQVNGANVLGSTPLHMAAGHGDGPGVQLLLSRGADVDARDMLQQTPLMVAAKKGNVDAVKRLRNAGANVNARDSAGMTPLMHAYGEGHLGLGLKLIAMGAMDDVTDNRGAGVKEYMALGVQARRARGESACTIL